MAKVRVKYVQFKDHVVMKVGKMDQSKSYIRELDGVLMICDEAQKRLTFSRDGDVKCIDEGNCAWWQPYPPDELEALLKRETEERQAQQKAAAETARKSGG